METEGSLPHSQVPVICPYPEPVRSSPYLFQVFTFPQVSPPKAYTRLFSPPYALHAPPISFFSILSPEQYLVRSTDH